VKLSDYLYDLQQWAKARKMEKEQMLDFLAKRLTGITLNKFNAIKETSKTSFDAVCAQLMNLRFGHQDKGTKRSAMESIKWKGVKQSAVEYLTKKKRAIEFCDGTIARSDADYADAIIEGIGHTTIRDRLKEKRISLERKESKEIVSLIEQKFLDLVGARTSDQGETTDEDLERREGILYIDENRMVKCFCCQEIGHKRPDCPKWKEKQRQLEAAKLAQAARKKPEHILLSGVKKKPLPVTEKPKRDMSQVKCFNCNQMGHMAKDCEFEDRRKKRKSEEENTSASDSKPTKIPKVCYSL